MTDRHLDLLNADIGALQPPSARRMLDIRDKREAGLTLRVVSKTKGRDAKRAWCWRYLDARASTADSYSGIGPRWTTGKPSKPSGRRRKPGPKGRIPWRSRTLHDAPLPAV